MWMKFFCIFRGLKDLFNDFVSLLNNMIESIKFNVEINTHNTFLDMKSFWNLENYCQLCIVNQRIKTASYMRRAPTQLI